MPNGSEWPRISIVTPSYNQGQFIEETIRSVLLQGYLNLEYIIFDGGSTDETVSILEKYDPFLTFWVSEKDGGQTDAINKGFKMATGDLIGWQNSDDWYQKCAFAHIAKTWTENEKYDIYHGNVNYVSEDGSFLFKAGEGEFHPLNMLPWQCIFNQSSFFSRKIFKEAQFLDLSKRHLMDYEFFWRLYRLGYRFKYVPEVAASHRQHANAKGSTQGDIAALEFFEIYKDIYAAISSRVDDGIQDSGEIRNKLLKCMAGRCFDDFGKLRLDLYRTHVRDMFDLGGFTSLNAMLILKYLISFLGEEKILFLKKIKSL